ncbi:MAG: hypothetical protein V3U57_07730 [Robiginitomaculum sp.]
MGITQTARTVTLAFTVISVLIGTVGGALAYFKGRHDGKSACEKQWKKGLDKAQTRVVDGANAIAAIADSAPGIVQTREEQRAELSARSQRKMGILEGQIKALREDLDNANNSENSENRCFGMRLPADVLLRQQKLDRLLEGAISPPYTRQDQD